MTSNGVLAHYFQSAVTEEEKKMWLPSLKKVRTVVSVRTVVVVVVVVVVDIVVVVVVVFVGGGVGGDVTNIP